MGRSKLVEVAAFITDLVIGEDVPTMKRLSSFLFLFSTLTLLTPLNFAVAVTLDFEDLQLGERYFGGSSFESRGVAVDVKNLLIVEHIPLPYPIPLPMPIPMEPLSPEASSSAPMGGGSTYPDFIGSATVSDEGLQMVELVMK